MAFALGTGFSDIDLSGITSGSDEAVVPDVSYGGPAEQPSNPAGNGSGQWILGTIDKALNYAIKRDSATMQGPNTQPPPLAVQQANKQAQNRQTLMFLGIGVLVFLVATK